MKELKEEWEVQEEVPHEDQPAGLLVLKHQANWIEKMKVLIDLIWEILDQEEREWLDLRDLLEITEEGLDLKAEFGLHI